MAFVQNIQKNSTQKEKKMNELEKVVGEINEKIGVELLYYPENAQKEGVPVCDKQFDEVTDDGDYTFFRFYFKGVGYIGVIKGVDKTAYANALLLPAYIESFTERETELSKTEYLRRILLGESSSMGIYKYANKFSLRGSSCFVLVLRLPKMVKETLAVITQYGGNSLDTAVQISTDTCALVKFNKETDEEALSSVDYAEFLAQVIKEELGLDVVIGVGPTVKEFKDVSTSFAQAENALRYADVFETQGKVHSYRDFILVKMLEALPESKLKEYLAEISGDGVKELFEDEDMLATAEEFLNSSLNVSETARNMYLHRNTLLYRLDKIEKETGLNIREFSSAVSFRVMTILRRLLGE